MSDIVGVYHLQASPIGDITHGFWCIEWNVAAIPHVVPVVEMIHVIVMEEGHDCKDAIGPQKFWKPVEVREGVFQMFDHFSSGDQVVFFPFIDSVRNIEQVVNVHMEIVVLIEYLGKYGCWTTAEIKALDITGDIGEDCIVQKSIQEIHVPCVIDWIVMGIVDLEFSSSEMMLASSFEIYSQKGQKW